MSPIVFLAWAPRIMPWFPARVPEQVVVPLLRWGKHRRVSFVGGRADMQLVLARSIGKTAAALSPFATPAGWTFPWDPQILPLSSI